MRTWIRAFVVSLSFFACDVHSANYSITFHVDARGLDYRSAKGFLKTMAKHPSDGSKNGDVGHAWICLEGKGIKIEGGHSGETGVLQPRYLEGVMNLCEVGDPNPIRYLWETQKDGFFEKGGGYHRPTFSAGKEITEEEFERVKRFIHPGNYPYREFSITGNQCTTFVVKVAELVGVYLEHEMTIPISRYVWFQGEKIRLWNDPKYGSITLGSPDRLQASLKQAVRDGVLSKTTGKLGGGEPQRSQTRL